VSKTFEPMTLANMRVKGVRAVTAKCEAYGHDSDVNVDALLETTLVPQAAERQRCSQGGGRTISIPPAGYTATRAGDPDHRRRPT
jgi:hypothetical protein